jgi:hypothetical protein
MDPYRSSAPSEARAATDYFLSEFHRPPLKNEAKKLSRVFETHGMEGVREFVTSRKKSRLDHARKLYDDLWDHDKGYDEFEQEPPPRRSPSPPRSPATDYFLSEFHRLPLKNEAKKLKSVFKNHGMEGVREFVTSRKKSRLDHARKLYHDLWDYDE